MIFPSPQASIRKEACYYDVECALGINITDPNALANMTDAQIAEYEEMLKKKAAINTEAIKVCGAFDKKNTEIQPIMFLYFS